MQTASHSKIADVFPHSGAVETETRQRSVSHMVGVAAHRAITTSRKDTIAGGHGPSFKGHVNLCGRCRGPRAKRNDRLLSTDSIPDIMKLSVTMRRAVVSQPGVAIGQIVHGLWKEASESIVQA